MKTLRRVLTPLNLHLAVIAVLVVLVLALAAKAVLAVHTAGIVDSSSYQQQALRAAELRAELAHIADLPKRADQARDAEQQFVQNRVAPNYSTLAEELGQAAIENGVRLARAQYTPSAPVDGIVEVRIDAGLSGSYVPMMKFINALERDKNHVFFIIDDLAFTGEQGGLVNLRLRVSAYLQAGATDLPPAMSAAPRAMLAAPSLGRSTPGYSPYGEPRRATGGMGRSTPFARSADGVLALLEVR